MDDRVKAVLEVLVAEAVFFVLAWYFEYLFGGGYGWFSKTVMILLGFIGIFLHRKPREYGLVPRSLKFSLKWCFYVVLIFSLASVAAVVASIFLGSFEAVGFYVLFVDLVWFMVFVGFAEELFFRGYVQSRLNEAFSRKFSKFLGVKYEWSEGTLVTGVVFFGLPHLLTGVNPFTGRVAFSPLVLIVTIFACFLGVVFGVIREKTGCILLSSVIHGLVDFTTFCLGKITGLMISSIASMISLFIFFYLMFEKMLSETVSS
ncbi:MAG: hypothetical protein DRN04_07045 [Thermoprotei archaeon]|nr:MAG: hypothetical protein DRN04_07045 [Thermoprotei archaeon]